MVVCDCVRDEHLEFHKVVETLVTGCGKRLYDFAAHLFRKLCTKFHQNHPRFVGDIIKSILVSFPDRRYFELNARRVSCGPIGTSHKKRIMLSWKAAGP